MTATRHAQHRSRGRARARPPRGATPGDQAQELADCTRRLDAAQRALRRETLRRRRAELAVRWSEHRLRALIDRAQIGVAVLSTHGGGPHRINSRMCAMLGESEAVLGTWSADTILARLVGAQGTSPPPEQDPARGPNLEVDDVGGHRRWNSISVSALRDEQGHLIEIAVLEDLDRGGAGNSLSDGAVQLTDSGRLRSLREIAAAIAHEISQPLSAIAANAGACLRLLAGGTAQLREVRAAVRAILADTDRASLIIAGIRETAHNRVAYPTWLDINALIGGALALSDERVRQAGVTVKTDLCAKPPRVLGDRIQLQQVLLNLINNAVDAMSRGGQERARELTLRTQRHGDAVSVAVQDTGPGIDPANASRLFESFFTTKAVGMGLGLSISRSIVEAHGGRLSFHANPQAGATFQFTLGASAGAAPARNGSAARSLRMRPLAAARASRR